MSEVKRFGYFWDGSFDVKDDGAFVKYEDYAELKEQFNFKHNLTEQVVALQKQRDELAYENANLKHLLSMIGETGNANFGKTTLYTPVTDAYLKSVRAEGVEMFAELHDAIAEKYRTESPGCYGEQLHQHASSVAVKFAAQLRDGKDGE